MSIASRERFAEVVRAGGAAGDPDDVRLDVALLLLSAEAMTDQDVAGPRLDILVDEGLAALDTLAAAVPPEGRDDLRLRSALAEFLGAPSDYGNLESSLLADVLKRRRGLPILLSTVWTEVARRAGVPAYGVGLPGHFVVGWETPMAHGCSSIPSRAGSSCPMTAPARSRPPSGGRSNPSTCVPTTQSTPSTECSAMSGRGPPPLSAPDTGYGRASLAWCFRDTILDFVATMARPLLP